MTTIKLTAAQEKVLRSTQTQGYITHSKGVSIHTICVLRDKFRFIESVEYGKWVLTLKGKEWLNANTEVSKEDLMELKLALGFEFVYEQPALPAQQFKVGDLVQPRYGNAFQITEIIWEESWLYCSETSFYFWWELTPVPSDHPLRPVFERAVEREKDVLQAGSEMDRLYAYFDAKATKKDIGDIMPEDTNERWGYSIQ